MAVSIAEPPPTATTASNGRRRGRRRSPPPSRRPSARRGAGEDHDLEPAGADALGDPLRVAGGGDAGVGHEEDATASPPDELLDVPADLGARTAAELEARRGVGEDGLGHETTSRSRRAWVTTSSTSTRPARTSATGTQAADSVVPSTSRTDGLAVAHGRGVEQVHAVVVLEPTGRCSAGEVGVVHADQRADLARQPALLLDLARERDRRVLAVVDAAARERPPAGVRGARGEPREQHLPVVAGAAQHDGVRRHPLQPEGQVVGERLADQPGGRDGAGDDVVERLPGGVDGRAVDLEDAWLRCVGGDPAGVDDADRVGVDELSVARGAGQVGAVDVGGLADRRVEPGLLVDLADDRQPGVLAVVDAAAREGPQLGARDLRREPAQQHLDAASVLAEHDGVRPHALSLRKGCHAPNLVKYGERRVPRVP